MSTAPLPDTASIYHAKLTDPHTAIQAVTSGSSVAIGQAASQPRALLGALALIDGAQFDHAGLDAHVAADLAPHVKLDFSIERLVECDRHGRRVVPGEGTGVECGDDVALQRLSL